jgi:hypothetical protein
MQSERRGACGALIFSTVATAPLAGGYADASALRDWLVGRQRRALERGIPNILPNIA